MHTLKASIRIPVINRSVSGNHPVSNKQLMQSASYVLNLYLQEFIKMYGDAELGKISINKIVFEEKDKYTEIITDSKL